MTQFKQDQNMICLSPFTAIQSVGHPPDHPPAQLANTPGNTILSPSPSAH